MRRFTLAMTMGLGFGLAVTGCGPTAENAAVPITKIAVDPPKADAAADDHAAAHAAQKGDPGGSGKGGVGMGNPPEVTKGMQSDNYRNTKPTEEPKTGGEAKKDPIVLSDEEVASIKKLPSEDDQKAALAQKICLVGEDEGKPNHLGSMGTPIKETVKGKTIFLCCKGCVDDFKKDPDKYLSKLGK